MGMGPTQAPATAKHYQQIHRTLDTTCSNFYPLEGATELYVIQVGPGTDVILPCEAGDASIRAVEWTRSDLESEEYVLFYSDGRSDLTHQKLCFGGRVQLVDGGLKNGDVSLRLRNVSNNDTGTYECRVAAGGSRRNKRANIKTQPIRSIQLEVTDSGSNNRNTMNGNITRGYVGLVAVAVLVCVIVGMFVGWKYKRHMDKKSELSADKVAGDQLI